MEDIQSGPAQVALDIDVVGVRQLTLPLFVKDRAAGRQQTVATVDIGVALPSSFKGTHMSRFVSALEQWNEELDYTSVTRLLADVRDRLEAKTAFVRFSFTYFINKSAPASAIRSHIGYACRLTGELLGGKTSFLLDVEVPVMTVCPCSKAISDEGAHSQRTLVRISVRMTGFSWIEDFVAMAENSASSPVYTLLKREDEKFVTEHAFANPTFVEDVVRNVATQLIQHPHVSWFRVVVESLESIHGHNAFACIEQHCDGKGDERRCGASVHGEFSF